MPTMNRRSFLKGAAALGAGVMLYRYSDGSYRMAFAAAGAPAYQLRLIHTNDHHARIEPAPNLTIGKTPDNKTATRNFGGVARRKTMFDQIAADATVQDKLFLDAGDVFQGTLYFNLYLGQADLYFYNNLGYAVTAVGNHEFDKGDQVFANYIKGAQFPILCANIAAVAPSPLAPLLVDTDITPAGKVGKRTIVTLASGKKIGLFSLIAPDTPLLSSPSQYVTFDSNLATIAQVQIDALKAAGADIVMALTHIGYLADLDLAAAIRGCPVIIGGHSHTPLLPDSETSLPLGVTRVAGYPTVVKDLDGSDVVVLQDWEWAKWICDSVISFDAAGKVALLTGGSNPTAPVEPVWADGILPTGRALLPGEQPEITPDAAFQNKINTDYKPGVDALSNQQIAAAGVFLDGERNNVRSKETNLSDLLTDALRNLILARPSFNPQGLPVVCMIGGGNIRASIAIGPLSVGGLINVLPFGNTVATAIVKGSGLLAAVENGLSQVESGAGRFPQVSGLRFMWNPLASPNQRVKWVQVAELTGTHVRAAATFKPLDLEREYLVVTNNFMLTGGDGYSMFTPAGGGTNQLDTGLLVTDVTQGYIQDTWPYRNLAGAYVPIDQEADGRIFKINSWIPIIFNRAAFVD